MRAEWHHARPRLSLAGAQMTQSCWQWASRSTESWNLHGAAQLLPWLLQHRQLHLRNVNNVLQHINACIPPSCVLILGSIPLASPISVWLGNQRVQPLRLPRGVYSTVVLGIVLCLLVKLSLLFTGSNYNQRCLSATWKATEVVSTCYLKDS